MLLLFRMASVGNPMDEQKHGDRIARRIEQISLDRLAVHQGTLCSAEARAGGLHHFGVGRFGQPQGTSAG